MFSIIEKATIEYVKANGISSYTKLIEENGVEDPLVEKCYERLFSVANRGLNAPAIGYQWIPSRFLRYSSVKSPVSGEIEELSKERLEEILECQKTLTKN